MYQAPGSNLGTLSPIPFSLLPYTGTLSSFSLRKPASETCSKELSLESQSASTFVFPIPALVEVKRIQASSPHISRRQASQHLPFLRHYWCERFTRNDCEWLWVSSERKAEAEGSPIVSRRSIGDENCMPTLPFLDSHPLLISSMLCMVQVAWIGPASQSPLLQAGQSPQGTLLEHQPRCPLVWGLQPGRPCEPSVPSYTDGTWLRALHTTGSLDTLLGDTGSNCAQKTSTWFLR